MGISGQPQIAEALKLLWQKFLPQMQERIAVLEDANRALDAGSLSAEQRCAAEAAAHKLAGVLGTFGLAEGTTLAREAETLFSETPDADQAGRLREISSQLKALILSHS
jgi:HPt (histidine-containing phosphotransfer) domain-containing protein